MQTKITQLCTIHQRSAYSSSERSAPIGKPYSFGQGFVGVADESLLTPHNLCRQLEVNGHSVIEPSAIQFCAMKVAAVAGDMRKALDICRRAVEAVETEVRKQQILSPGGLPVFLTDLWNGPSDVFPSVRFNDNECYE